jgi:sulfatase maturation enzyme AslB (radical SAM superfamily)
MKINQRLFDHYGIETSKDLEIKKKCGRPFDTVLIDKMGSCYACECTAWLPQSIGNLHINHLHQILRSSEAQELRDSINDGSYKYCNIKQCMYLMDISRVPWTDETPAADLKEIRLAIDDSCNLACPSCRKEQIFVRSGKQMTMRMRLIDRVLDYIRKHHRGPLNIHIGSDGDPFASLVYRYFMRNVVGLDNLSYTFQTNGLLVKKMYGRVTHVFDKLAALNLSIDGATKETYERLRKGGQWRGIVENMQFIKDIKQQHRFKFHMHMVVQKDNWREMPRMLELASQYDADTVYFNPIQDWNTSSNFEDMRAPEELEEFQATLEQIKQNPIANAW